MCVAKHDIVPADQKVPGLPPCEPQIGYTAGNQLKDALGFPSIGKQCDMHSYSIPNDKMMTMNSTDPVSYTHLTLPTKA